jgi:hypothetical protein
MHIELSVVVMEMLCAEAAEAEKTSTEIQRVNLFFMGCLFSAKVISGE